MGGTTNPNPLTLFLTATANSQGILRRAVPHLLKIWRQSMRWMMNEAMPTDTEMGLYWAKLILFTFELWSESSGTHTRGLCCVRYLDPVAGVLV